MALAVGYFNGDTILDVAVGAPGDSSGNGVVQFLFGPITEGVDLGGTAVETLFGLGPERAGATVITLDWDYDGVDDLLIGAPSQDSVFGAKSYDDSGAVYLLSGPILTSDPLENAARGVLTYSGEEDAGLGTALSDAGDLDGDGYTELIRGCPIG